jgi:rare lipoprotein A (peptidoglycan hydrolase)
LLCAGLLLVPLIALSGGGPEIPSITRVAEAAPLVSTPQPVVLAAADTPAVPAADPPTTAAAAPAMAVAVAGVTRAVPATTTTAVRPPAVHIASVPVSRRQPTTTTTTINPSRSESGKASWYGAAKGTCAHQTLPFGTVVHIWDQDTGRSATCTVDDRGPYQDNRIIDLSPDVFQQLAPTSDGVIQVQISW